MRVPEVDALRGIAIILMVIYHFFFDLSYFGLADINLYEFEWQLFQRTVGFLFIFVMGMSLTLSEAKNREGYARHAKRAAKLAAVALLITIATWVYPHEGFIMFGIIHFIAAATLIGPLFFRLGYWNVLLGIVIIAAGFCIGSMHIDSQYLFWLGITYPGYMPLDHYSLIPWFGVVLLGIYAGQRFFPKAKPMLKKTDSMGKLAFLGRNALLIYLLHQPLMIGMLFLVQPSFFLP